MSQEKIYRIIGKEGTVTIPCTLRALAGFEPNEVVSFCLIGEGAIIVQREKLMAPNVELCESEMPTLKDFLEGLSEKERYAALVHLSVLWAEGHDQNPRKGCAGCN